MAILKSKEISKMNETEIDSKIKDLKMELIKSKTGNKKSGNPIQIRRTIARLLTFKKLKKQEGNK